MVQRTAIAAAAWLAMVGPATALTLTPDDVDAIGRVVQAEAGNQGVAGRAAVLSVILNRLESGRWGTTVQAVIDAPHQFEPVARSACHSWRCLPEISRDRQTELATLLSLAAIGKLGDVSEGAMYFQNPAVVTARGGPVNFGGLPVTAEIGQHRFYATKSEPPVPPIPPGMGSMFASVDISRDEVAPAPGDIP